MLDHPSALTVLIVGDHLSHAETHHATDAALRHAAIDLGLDIEIVWMPTATIDADTAEHLGGVDAMVAVPGNYASSDGAIAAIEVARTNRIPFLGTCGGMQHMVLEIARNVVGATSAAHAERDPDADDQWITELACSLAGQSAEVTIRPDTIASAAYGTETTNESFYCRFGIAPERVSDLEAIGLTISGADDAGEPRIVELRSHPFLVGTLFVPQVRSRIDAPHPLITALLATASG